MIFGPYLYLSSTITSLFDCIYKHTHTNIYLQTWETPGWNLKPDPIIEGKETLKKDADLSRLLGDSLISNGNCFLFCLLNKQNKLLLNEAFLGQPHDEYISALTRILKVYTEVLTGFSYDNCPDGVNNTLLSQGCVLESGFHCRNSGKSVYSKHRVGNKELLIA